MQIVSLLFITSCAAQDLFLAAERSGASTADLVRASTQTQSGRLAGSSSREIAEKINAYIKNSGVQTKACDEHSLKELNELVISMWPLFSAELEQVYKGNADSRAKRFATLAEYQRSWADELESDAATLRHAKCHEVVMMWAHHISEAGKKSWQGQSLPSLPVYDEKKASNKAYARSTSCQTGHAMATGGGSSTHKWPDWPEELHYKAKAHGAYPFWWGGGSDEGTADMEVWWSEKQGAEKFSHSSCTGQSPWLNGPCVHLMLAAGASPPTPSPTPPSPPSPPSPGSCTSCRKDRRVGCAWAPPGRPCMDCMAQIPHADCKVPDCVDETQRVCAGPAATLLATSKPRAYLYTKDESKCCISEPGGYFAETLAPSQGTFWNTFKDMGERAFNGVHYKGKVKYYLLSGVNEPVTDFWYFTSLDGKPVQQGEGGKGPTDQGYPTSIGHTIWHDYDQSTFNSSAIDPSVFAIPAACKTTSLRCAFP